MTSGLRNNETEAMRRIEITIQISGDVKPPALNIAMSLEQLSHTVSNENAAIFTQNDKFFFLINGFIQAIFARASV